VFERRPSRSADQYSLALIYAEMLTGAHPRPNRPGSGLTPRAGHRSGVHRSVKIDLGLVPVRDREALARALSNDPERRFPTCAAFVEALEQAGRDSSAPDLYHTLPPVIPYASLMGEPAAPDVVLPTVAQLIQSLTAPPDPRKVYGPQNTRYFIRDDGAWEYRCPVQMFPGAMKLKVAGFCGQWNARLVGEDGESFRVQLDVPVPRRIEVAVEVDRQTGAASRLTEARVRVRSLGCEGAQAERILATMAPALFDSVRLYLQAEPEQRTLDRVPCDAPLRVYPVLPDLELAPTIEGVCRDISPGGMRFRVGRRPPVDQLYLHLCASPEAMGHAILARVARVTESEGAVEVGVRFATG
jgi:hypothetical protein